MRPFEFHSARNEDAVFERLAGSVPARIVAGGTSILDLMKLDVERPERVVDVTRLPLADVTEENGSLWIGSLVRNSDLAHHPLVKKLVPVLSEALLAGASPQLRNLATAGGNLLQRTRCSYFRDMAWACNKREPGSGCSAIEGINRSHAILGTSESCVATSPSDMNVALMALRARIHVRSGVAQRVIPIDEFYRLPGSTPHIETSLGANELITRIEIPIEPWYSHSRYVKVRDRASYAFALASSAVSLQVDAGVIRQSRIALGGVGTIPWRAREAEAVLEGRPATREAFHAAAEAALESAKPLRHNAFKKELAKATLVRALEELGAKQ
jgi:xanthine dehydrogenase YagS FAD-binding subunit